VTYSHKSAIHLLFNCLALESFGRRPCLMRKLWTYPYSGHAAYYYLLRGQSKAEPEMLESTTSYHFLAFFITGLSLLFLGLSFSPILLHSGNVLWSRLAHRQR
jgi:hypothetical protein